MSCQPPINLGVFTVGEKPASLSYQFLDFDGNIINLTGYTAKFVWQAKFNAGGAGVTGNGTIPNPTDGKAEYTWNGTEFATPGQYVGQVWVGNGTNRYASTRILWTVQQPTGTVPAI